MERGKSNVDMGKVIENLKRAGSKLAGDEVTP